MDPRWYIYRMTCDNGGAPCVQNGMLSLAICKPVIRRKAQIGDWLIGVGGVPLDRRLIYMAEITDVAEDGDYYRDPRFSRRRDRVYKFNDTGRMVLRPGARYHFDGVSLPRDIGSPDVAGSYPAARVLLSNNFRYLGENGTAAMVEECDNLNRVLIKLSRGHRVNNSPEVMRDLASLQRRLWEDTGCLQAGRPSEPPERTVCQGK